MKTFTLTRDDQTDFSTWGELADPNGAAICKILERGLHNENHPRIPAGTYEIGRKAIGQSEFDASLKVLLGDAYKGILWLPHVQGRTNIEIHTANTVEQLLGCLASGTTIVHDSLGDFMILGGTSRPAYAKLYQPISAAIDKDGAQLVIGGLP